MRNIIIVSNRFRTFQELYDLLSDAGYAHIHHAIDSGDLSHMIYRLQPRLIVVDTGVPREELDNLVRLLNNPISRITLFLLPERGDSSIVQLLSGHGFTNLIACPFDNPALVKTVGRFVDLDQHNS